MSRFLDLINNHLEPQPEDNKDLEVKEEVETPTSSLPTPKKSRKKSRK